MNVVLVIRLFSIRKIGSAFILPIKDGLLLIQSRHWKYKTKIIFIYVYTLTEWYGIKITFTNMFLIFYYFI